MSFSHRDRRAHRTVWRVLAGVCGGGLALGALAFYGPDAALGLAALCGLAALGWAAMLAGERAVSEYGHDLRTVLESDAERGFVHAEVRSDVGLEREVGRPSGRSPHVRPPSPTPDPVRPSARAP